MAKKNKKKGFFKRVVIVSVILILGSVALFFYDTYSKIYAPNISIKSNGPSYLYIPTGSNLDKVVYLLDSMGVISNTSAFIWVAEKKNYKNNIKPGKYRLEEGMNNNELINKLRSGEQEPVKLVFTEVRTQKEFIERICSQLETDFNELSALLSNNKFLNESGFNDENVMAMFIPDTYEFYWNTNARDFFNRMYAEYKHFWNNQRTSKADKLGLSKIKVSILASIVQQESHFDDDRRKIAGVYYNRLRKGMRLQADPTVIFAVGDFTIRRVLNEHLNYDSPYNTYKYEGLPPGPICIAGKQSIEAVLNMSNHNYLYFCASDDFSGKHLFASNLTEHDRNAARFRKALNKRKIYR